LYHKLRISYKDLKSSLETCEEMIQSKLGYLNVKILKTQNLPADANLMVNRQIGKIIKIDNSYGRQ